MKRNIKRMSMFNRSFYVFLLAILLLIAVSLLIIGLISAGSKPNTNKYIGMSFEEARLAVSEDGYLPKVTSIDGEPAINNAMGMCNGYVYLVIKDETVTSARYEPDRGIC